MLTLNISPSQRDKTQLSKNDIVKIRGGIEKYKIIKVDYQRASLSLAKLELKKFTSKDIIIMPTDKVYKV